MTVTALPATPRPFKIQVVAWVATAMIAFMLLTQLYKFEQFASVLSALMSSADQPLVAVAAAGIVLAELLALPFLLAMVLSKLMRALSAVLGVGVAVFWFFLQLTSGHAANSGLFGSTLDLPGGIAAVCWSLLLLGCVITPLVYLKRDAEKPAS